MSLRVRALADVRGQVVLRHDAAVLADAPRHALGDTACVKGRLAALGQRPELVLG